MIQFYIYIYLFFFKFFSHLNCYKILNKVPHRSWLIIHFKYSSVYMSVPNSQSIPPSHSPCLLTISSFSKSVSLPPFCN